MLGGRGNLSAVETARLLREQGRLIQAAELLLRHVVKEPDDAVAGMELGILLADLGFVSPAREQLERSIGLDPTLRQAREALEELEYLLEGPPGPEHLLP